VRALCSVSEGFVREVTMPPGEGFVREVTMLPGEGFVQGGDDSARRRQTARALSTEVATQEDGIQGSDRGLLISFLFLSDGRCYGRGAVVLDGTTR
jgi:hypothetical protein